MFTSERQWKRDFPGHSWSLGRSFHRVHCGYDALYIQTPKNIKELRHMRMPYKPCFHCCQAATAMKAIFWPSSAKCAHFCDFPFVVGLLRHFREVYEGVKQRDLQATKMENELMFHHCHWNAQMYLRYSSYHHHVYIYIYNTIPKRSVPRVIVWVFVSWSDCRLRLASQSFGAPALAPALVRAPLPRPAPGRRMVDHRSRLTWATKGGSVLQFPQFKKEKQMRENVLKTGGKNGKFFL